MNLQSISAKLLNFDILNALVKLDWNQNHDAKRLAKKIAIFCIFLLTSILRGVILTIDNKRNARLIPQKGTEIHAEVLVRKLHE